MKLHISPTMAKGLWDYLSDEYGSILVSKQDSAMMRAIGWLLDGIGVLDHDDFLRNYATTLIDTVYLPFTPGATDSKWTPTAQVFLAVHEHHHVWQSDEYGVLPFAAGYLASKSARAHYEAEAYRTNLEMHYWLTGQVPDPMKYASRIKNYGCGLDEVRYINAYLQMSIPAIKSGEQVSEVVSDAIHWLSSSHEYGPS